MKSPARVSDEGGGRIHGRGGSFGDHLRAAGRNKHPNVGALIGTYDGQQYPYCSGTLISPTVFLTAAHCGDDGSTVYVTFDSTPDSKSKLYSGTFQANELYPGSQEDPYDIAVVVFDKPIRSIEPAELPTLGQFDSLPKDQQFTAVGYGGQEAINQPGGPVIGYLDTREYAVSTLNAVGPSYLRLSQNPATGDGGTCYGDFGGPNSLGPALPRRTSSPASPSPVTRCASPPRYGSSRPHKEATALRRRSLGQSGASSFASVVSERSHREA